jgi:RNA polymerase sigma-70 factor, ECF subfamily
MQEVFTRLVAHRGALRGDAPVLHWLYRVTTNHCLDQLRRRKTHPVVEDPEAMNRIARGDEAQAVNRTAVLALLAALRAGDRDIAIYYYLDRMTTEEVAQVAGCSRKTVTRRLARIQKRARVLLR